MQIIQNGALQNTTQIMEREQKERVKLQQEKQYLIVQEKSYLKQ